MFFSRYYVYKPKAVKDMFIGKKANRLIHETNCRFQKEGTFTYGALIGPHLTEEKWNSFINVAGKKKTEK